MPTTGSEAPKKKSWAQTSVREVIRERYFPDVHLTTHNGVSVRLYEDLMKDKIVVMNFFYATCEGICVPLTSNLVKVQTLLKARVGRDIFMYSFTLKPELDSPSVLHDYAQRFHVRPGWTFLTGTPDDMELVRRKLGFTDPDPTRDQDKTNHTGMVRYGNEPLQLWSACPGMSRPDSVVKSILAVDWKDPQRPRKG